MTFAAKTTAKTNDTNSQPHNLVEQIRTARKEWRLIFDGVSDEDGDRRLGRMNSLGWFMAHLAWHEMINLAAFTGEMVAPELNEIAAKDGPATTPKLSEMRELWEKVIVAADAYLVTLSDEDMLGEMNYFGQAYPENVGAVLQRVNNHYFYHNGEAAAIRQLLDQNFAEVMNEVGAMTYVSEK